MKEKTLICFSLLSFFIIVECSKRITPYELEKLYNKGQYDKVAKILGVVPDFIIPGAKDPVTLTNMLQNGIEQFDILLSESQQKTRREHPNYTINPGNRWKSKEIPYFILESSFNSSDAINTVKGGIQRFNNEVTSLQFTQWKPDNNDCVIIYKGNRRFSNLGHMGGLQSISLLTTEDFTFGGINHLMMHTLGFSHEINRPDRDNYIKIMFENIPKVIHSVFFHGDPKTYKVIGPYDYYSIMHLSTHVNGVEYLKVLKPNIDLARIGDLVDLSEMDIYKLDNIYPM